jgi:hypothetical protein
VVVNNSVASRPETKISVWRRINLPEPSAISGALRKQPRPETQISVWRSLSSSSVIKVKKMVWRRKDNQHPPKDTDIAVRH